MKTQLKPFIVRISIFICLSLVMPMAWPAYLPNYGNENASLSCFLNSTIQALFHTKPLREYLKQYESLYPVGSVSQLFIQHIHDMEKTTETKTPCSPAAF